MPKYNHIDNIPAKIFFEVLKTKDFQQLKPKPREKDLENVFMLIYDDYFLRTDSEQAKEFLRLQNVIVAQQFKIHTLKSSLAFYYYNSTTKKMREGFIEALEIGYGIVIDQNVPFEDEVLRVLNIEVGILENEISLAKATMEDMKKGSVKEDFDFYDMMIGMANVLAGNTLINDTMTLAVFVALQKSMRKQTEKKAA